MKRLATVDLNTPEHFDEIWKLENTHYFDRVRMEAFTDHVRPGMVVLDVGAGICGWGEYLLNTTAAGNFAAALSPEGGLKEQELRLPSPQVHAIDFCKYARDLVSDRCPEIKYILGNVLDLPYPSDTFDVVGSGEVIEHMERPELMVAEMARVAKRGGWIIIGTVDPDCEDSRTRGCDYPEHLWQFSVDELIGLGSVHGPTHYRRVGNYDFVYCQKA